MPTSTLPAALPRIYAWFSAVIANDTDLLSGLIAHGLPVDTLHPLRHSTALMEATRLGRAGMVQWLLEHGAAPAFLCGLPLGTALHCAIRHHRWDIAQTLANAMDNCAVIDTHGATPLHLLCAESCPKNNLEISLGLATLLLTKHCSLDALDHEGTTALHHCVINNLRDMAHLLLMRGANPNALIPGSHVSPLTIAALEKNMPMARLLIEHGGDITLKTREGSSPASIYPALKRAMATTGAN